MWAWLNRSTGEVATSWKRGEPKSHYFDCDCDNNLKCYACSICLITAKDNLPVENVNDKCYFPKCNEDGIYIILHTTPKRGTRTVRICKKHLEGISNEVKQ